MRLEKRGFPGSVWTGQNHQHRWLIRLWQLRPPQRIDPPQCVPPCAYHPLRYEQASQPDRKPPQSEEKGAHREHFARAVDRRAFRCPPDIRPKTSWHRACVELTHPCRAAKNPLPGQVMPRTQFASQWNALSNRQQIGRPEPTRRRALQVVPCITNAQQLCIVNVAGCVLLPYSAKFITTSPPGTAR